VGCDSPHLNTNKGGLQTSAWRGLASASFIISRIAALADPDEASIGRISDVGFKSQKLLTSLGCSEWPIFVSTHFLHAVDLLDFAVMYAPPHTPYP
jgi:hypothetical protein